MRSNNKVIGFHTENRVNRVHISGVTPAGARVASAVTMGEEARGVVAHKREQEYCSRACNPTQLSNVP